MSVPIFKYHHGVNIEFKRKMAAVENFEDGVIIDKLDGIPIINDINSKFFWNISQGLDGNNGKNLFIYVPFPHVVIYEEDYFLSQSSSLTTGTRGIYISIDNLVLTTGEYLITNNNISYVSKSEKYPKLSKYLYNNNEGLHYLINNANMIFLKKFLN